MTISIWTNNFRNKFLVEKVDIIPCIEIGNCAVRNLLEDEIQNIHVRYNLKRDHYLECITSKQTPSNKKRRT